ncbi:hypothetical protein [Chordicoccus furentiruminis]|nr:hypothetical protein [Chordicoccus furentiruminis]
MGRIRMQGMVFRNRMDSRTEAHRSNRRAKTHRRAARFVRLTMRAALLQ